MSAHLKTALLLLALTPALLCACQDPPMTPMSFDDGVSVPPRLDMGSMENMLPLPDQGGAAPDMTPPPLPPAGWIELEVSPERVYYTWSDEPSVEATVYDAYGQIVEAAEVVFELGGSIGELTVDGPLSASLQLTQDGEGTLLACIGDEVGSGASGARVCARRSFLVDNSPPSIEVLWPPRSAQLAPFDAPSVPLTLPPPDESEDWIPVVAQITDGQRAPIVHLNGRSVTLQEGGRLEAYLPATVGYHEIDITVDDGVRLSVTRDRRWVLWADDYLPFDESSVTLPEGAQFSLNQSFLDQDLPLDLEANPLIATELAQLVRMFLTLADPTTLLPSAQLGSGGFSLSLGELSLGDPSVDVHFTEDGISLYVELSEVSLSTEGTINLGGQNLSLDGSLEVGLAVYGDFALETRGAERPLVLRARGSGVAITTVSADFVNPTAEALIEALDNEARQLVVENVEGALQSIIRDELPPLLEQSVNSLFATVDYIPFTLDSGLEGAPVLRLALQVSPQRLEVIRQENAALWCDISVEHRDGPPAGPGEGVTVRGVPISSADLTPPVLPSAFTLHLQQTMLTMLLAEVWRGGLLSLSPPLPAEASALVSEVQLVAQTPPVIVPGEPGDAYPLYLELGGLHLEMSGPLSPETDEYEVFARVGARLNVDGGAFTIELEEEPAITATVKVLRNRRPVLAEELLARVISSSVWPTLSAGITSQLRIGLEEAPLDLRPFAQLGLELQSARMVPLFDADTVIRGGWMSLKGMIEARFER